MSRKITKTEQEWRTELTPHQYEILRRKGTEPAFSGEYAFTQAGRHVSPLRGLLQRAVPLRRQVRLRHGLAELHRARGRAGESSCVRTTAVFHEAHRGAVPHLRLAPWARLR